VKLLGYLEQCGKKKCCPEIFDQRALTFLTHNFRITAIMILTRFELTSGIEALYDQYHEVYPKFHQRFQEHLCWVGDFLTAYIGNQLKDMPIRAIYLNLFSDIKRIYKKYEEYDKSKGVNYMTINMFFDFDTYLTLTDNTQKKQMMAQNVCEELTILFLERQWNIKPILSIFDKMQRQNYIWEGVLRPSWCNPNRTHRVKIWFNYELEEVKLVAILYRNHKPKDDICKRDFITFCPRPWCIPEYIANIHWENDVILSSFSPNFAKKITRVDFSDIIMGYNSFEVIK
jgi:hypothetical protein